MYLPKSKYKSGRRALRGEYVYAKTGRDYTGPYFVTYTSETYTGTRPSSKSELIVPVDLDNDSVYSTTNEVLIETAEYDTAPLGSRYDLVRRNDTELQLRATLPIPLYYPKPSPADYTKGVIKRYFAIDKNTGQILEVSSKVYASMKAQKPEYYYPKYTLKTINWSLRDRSANRINSSVTKLDTYLKDPSQFVR